ncbi:hypothetical protein PQX77_020829 [Marasmius sp. AFHP31]|nr:hypothetical protein PQX77_020829 [Marasmius sp. AFHP31]
MSDSPPLAEGQEGDTDDRPIVLPSITCNDSRVSFNRLVPPFERTKKPVCRSFSKTKARSKKLSLQDYTDLLSIATRYKCFEAGRKSIQEIECHEPDARKKILLAQKYHAEESLMPAYNRSRKRDEPLTRTEEEIEIDKAVMIAAAWENICVSEESGSMITTGGGSYTTSTSAFGAPSAFSSLHLWWYLHGLLVFSKTVA